MDLALKVVTVSLPSASPPSYRAIENLIATYVELVDDGDFAGLGTLLADATFTGSGAPVSSPDAIEKMFRGMLIVYDGGTPRTKHVTTNIVIEVDEEAGAAVSRAYFTVLQALPGLPLQPIASGRCRDRFERRGGQWRFAGRAGGACRRHTSRPRGRRDAPMAAGHPSPVREHAPVVPGRGYRLPIAFQKDHLAAKTWWAQLGSNQ